MYVAVTESGYGQTTVYGVMMSLAHLCFLYILYTWFIYRLLEYLLTAYDTYLTLNTHVLILIPIINLI